MTLEEYLRTAHEYEEEPDFVDDHVEGRCIGEMPHSMVIGNVLMGLATQESATGWRVLPSLSLRVSPSRIRIADVCLIPRGTREPIPSTPPLLCVEVLGSEDTIPAMASRCEDYLTMGVPVVWILDPWTHSAYMLTASAAVTQVDDVLEASEARVRLTLDDAFRQT